MGWTVLEETVSSCAVLVLHVITDCTGEVWIFDIADMFPKIFYAWVASLYDGRLVLSILDLPQTICSRAR